MMGLGTKFQSTSYIKIRSMRRSIFQWKVSSLYFLKNWGVLLFLWYAWPVLGQSPRQCELAVRIRVSAPVCTGKPFKISAIVDTLPPGSTYSWNTGQTQLSFEDTINAPTTYRVTVTQPSGCTSVDSISIIPSLSPRAQLPNAIQICPGQVLTLEPALSGGTGPFSFDWGLLGKSPTILVKPTEPEQYAVKVTDANGCSDAVTTTVIPNRSLEIIMEDSIGICPDNVITLIPRVTGHTGPLSYQWNTGEKTALLMISSSVSQSYKVIATDSLGCQGMDSIYVQVYGIPTESAMDTLQVCAGNTLNIPPPLLPTSGQPYSYVWQNGSTLPSISVSPVISGIIQRTVTDRNGCSFSRNVYVQVNAKPEIFLPDSLRTCLGSTASLSPILLGGTPGYTFAWSTGETTSLLTRSFSNSGPLRLFIRDANGCADTAVVQVLTNLPPQVSLPDILSVCASDSVKLTPVTSAQNLKFQWENGQEGPVRFFPKPQAGRFILTATTPSGCSTVVSTLVRVLPLPIIQIPPVVQACQGSEVSIGAQVQIANGPVSFQWSNGRTGPLVKLIVQDSLRLTCRATDNLGCTATEQVQIIPRPNPSITLPSILSVCYGQKLTLQPVQPTGDSAIIFWNTGNIGPALEVQPESTTLFTAIATNKFTCRDTAGITVEVRNLPKISITGPRSFCEGSSTLLTASVLSGSTPFQYTWSTGSNGTFTKVDSSNYNKETVQLRTTDVHGCISTDTAIIRLLSSPQVRFPTDIRVCENQTGTVSPIVTGGEKPYSYLWSNGLNTATATLGAGSYQVEVADAQGCRNAGIVRIIGQSPPEMEILKQVAPSCGNPDGEVDLSVRSSTPPITVRWSTGALGTSQKMLAAGAYTVTAKDSLNCQREIKIELNCLCTSRIGKMETLPTTFCRFDTSVAKYDPTGQVLPTGTRRWFILHNNPGSQIGNVVLYSDSLPLIRYQAGMIAGKTYYLSAVVATIAASGGPNFGDQCLAVSPGTPVTLLPEPEQPTQLIVADSLVCPGSTFQIGTNRQFDGVSYVWHTPRGIFTTSSPSYTLSNFSVADVGTYFVSAAFGQCSSDRMGPLNIRIAREVAEIFTEPDKILCGTDSTTLQANAPAGAMGKWTSSSPANILSPNEELTPVKGLAPGTNLFTWNVITRSCVVRDTLAVYYFAKPIARNDTFYLDDDRNTALFDLFKNDILKDIPPEHLQIELLKQPGPGIVRTDEQGNLLFQRDNTAVQDQQYTLSYRVCNNDPGVRCGERCSEAQIYINVAYNPKTLIYPATGLRPGNRNPVWQFETARPMFSARLSILDRWGQVVYKEDFQELQKGELVKSWDGLRGGNALAPGAYYFALEGTIEDNERVVQTGILYLMK